MWGRDVDTTTVPVVVADDANLVSVEVVRGRIMALTLVALRGQGITQLEAFAFADAFGVWDHLSLAEHDFILEVEPSGTELIQFAWCFERASVMEWALGVVRHVGFPDMGVDTAKVSEACIRDVANAEVSKLAFRDLKDLLDLADVTRCCAALNEGAVNRGIAIERARAFAEMGIPC
jgi:Domain of unknown function (DUF4272)